jgi:hypothetical protein
VLANDSDPNGDWLSVASLDTSGILGVAVFTGELDPGFDGFGYTFTDFGGGDDRAMPCSST